MAWVPTVRHEQLGEEDVPLSREGDSRIIHVQLKAIMIKSLPEGPAPTGGGQRPQRVLGMEERTVSYAQF